MPARSAEAEPTAQERPASGRRTTTRNAAPASSATVNSGTASRTSVSRATIASRATISRATIASRATVSSPGPERRRAGAVRRRRRGRRPAPRPALPRPSRPQPRPRWRQQAEPRSNDAEPTVTDDDVLIPVAGIVDASEEKNTWFVRVGGYFPTPDDVYISNSIVRRYGLRRGDAVTGAVRQPREGERREKYNPLVRLDTVNGDRRTRRATASSSPS